MATKLEKEIIQKMDGKRTFGKIGQEFGLSYQTIKGIAERNGIERPKSKKKLSLEKRALDLLDGTITKKEVAKRLKVSTPTIDRICKEYDITIDGRNLRAFTDRNDELVSLLKEGKLNYVELGKRFGITKARVYQFAKANGVSRWKISREKHKAIAIAIEVDYKAGLSYKEIRDKYNLLKLDRETLKRYGYTSLSQRFRSERNKLIISEYKRKSAKVVLQSDKPSMDNPDRLTSVDSIYSISSRSGFKKYPNIGNRNAGGVFEKPEIIKFIKDKRDKNGLNFIEITTLLNSKGWRSPMNKEYKVANVYQKYLAIKRHNV